MVDEAHGGENDQPKSWIDQKGPVLRNMKVSTAKAEEDEQTDMVGTK